ncbi:DNA repair protein rhp54 [Hordeum vulgare]|nr:DNA repair protein rhp54 [Hordeum vulgare]
MTIDLNATLASGGSSIRVQRKRSCEIHTGNHPTACNVFDSMPESTDDDIDKRYIMENIIFEDDMGGVAFYPDETQSRDGRDTFTAGQEGMDDTFKQGHNCMEVTFT